MLFLEEPEPHGLLLLEDTDLAPKPFILPRELAVLGRHHIRVTMRRHHLFKVDMPTFKSSTT